VVPTAGLYSGDTGSSLLWQAGNQVEISYLSPSIQTLCDILK